MRTLLYLYICHRNPPNAHGLGFKTASATKDLMNFNFEPSIPLHWRTLNDQRSMVMSRFRNISESLAFYGWWDCTAGVQGMLTYILFSAGLFISTARGYLLFLAYKLISRAKSCELDVTCLTTWPCLLPWLPTWLCLLPCVLYSTQLKVSNATWNGHHYQQCNPGILKPIDSQAGP